MTRRKLREMKKNQNVIIIRSLIIISFILLWEWAASTGRVSMFYTSKPSLILKDLVQFTVSGDLAKHASVTLKEAFVGLF